MKRTVFVSRVLVALTCIGAAQAQFSLDGDIVAPGPRFNIDKFEQNIRIAVARKSVGFAYAISQNGQLKRADAGGKARTEVDVNQASFPNGIPQHENKRMNIASISKPITAATVHRILQNQMVPGYPNLTVDSKVAPFLPSSWTKGPGVANLTIGELLSQYSGMFDNGGSTSTADLKTWIATGVTRPKSDYIYINANIAIFRIVIPYLLSDFFGRLQLNVLAEIAPDQFSEECADIYKQAVRNLIFHPMGINNAEMRSTDPLSTLFYSTDPLEKGVQTGDWSEVGGGGGWYLSAVEIAKFLAHLRYNNSILTPETRQIMNNLSNCPGDNCRLLGWQRPIEGAHGLYYYHSGSLTYGSEPKSGMRGIAMNFPNGVQGVLLVNSIGPYGNIINVMKDAFDNAWE